jgi:hypothetical protein
VPPALLLLILSLDLPLCYLSRPWNTVPDKLWLGIWFIQAFIRRIGSHGQLMVFSVIMIDLIGKSVDAKTYFAVSTNNERIGDPGLGIMQTIIKLYPEYDTAILKIWDMMKERKCQLILQDENVHAESFNSEMTNEDFATLLNDCEKKQRTDLINIILKQAF